MAGPEPSSARAQRDDLGAPAVEEPPSRRGRRRRGYVGALALLILILLAVNSTLNKRIAASGVAPGTSLPPFAVPLVLSDLSGDADIATRSDQGAAGRVPACRERGARILNICALYEQGPLVLALFVNGGGCERVLSQMQALVGVFPGVRFAAVSIKGDREGLRRLVRSRGLTFPVGIDRDGALAELYKDVTCPQVSFAYRGGVVQQRALLASPTAAVLRARVADLVAAQLARQAAG
jgi:hypothetical protein